MKDLFDKLSSSLKNTCKEALDQTQKTVDQAGKEDNMGFFKWLWQNPISILWLYLAVMNLVTFIVMGLDKFYAKKGKRRVPESTLFLLSIIGGSIGGILGIYAFRHKTLHKQFTVGFPIILILQTALGIFIYIYAK